MRPLKMKKTAVSKAVMIIAGLFAAAIILFSQSLYQQAQLAQKKNAEHKKSVWLQAQAIG